MPFCLGLRNRSNSLTGMDGQPRGSVVAWPDKRQRYLVFKNLQVHSSDGIRFMGYDFWDTTVFGLYF